MDKHEQNWEAGLKEQPFAGPHFTPQLKEAVERRVKERRARPFRTGIAAAAASLLLAGGALFGYAVIKPAKAPESGSVTNAVPPGTGPVGPSAAPQNKPGISFPGGIRLPLKIVKAEPAIGDSSEWTVTSPPPAPLELDFPVPSSLENRLEAILVYRPDLPGAHLLLAPAGWGAEAVVGANGSFGVTFSDPGHGGTSLQYSDNFWSCAGCAISSIGAYFPDKADWAEEQGFAVYEPLSFSAWSRIGTTGADSRTVRYRLGADAGGYTAEGAAYYSEGGDGYLFRQLEFRQQAGTATLPEQETDTILRFFTANYGAFPVVAEEESAVGDTTGKTAGAFSEEEVAAALTQRGLVLTPAEQDDLLFPAELNGKQPVELLINPLPPSRPERLSVYAYPDAPECAQGLEALKREINRTTFSGGARIYPHVFRGANILAVYWTGGDSEVPFSHDKAIKEVLKEMDEPARR